MSTIERLQAKYPHHAIKSEPLPDCRVCKGTGEFRNQSGFDTACLCVCLSSELSDDVRRLGVNGLQSTVKKLQQEMKK